MEEKERKRERGMIAARGDIATWQSVGRSSVGLY